MPTGNQQTAPMWIDVASLDPNMPNLSDKFEIKGIAMPAAADEEEADECSCVCEGDVVAPCYKCSKPEEPAPEKPFERSGDAQRTLMDLMADDHQHPGAITQAGMLVKDKEGQAALLTLTKDDVRGMLVPSLASVSSSYVTLASANITGRSVYCPNIVLCSAKISVDRTAEGPSINYKMIPENSTNACIQGSMPASHSLAVFVKNLRHALMPSLNAFTSHSTALYDTTNSSEPVFKIKLPDVHKDFMMAAVKAYCQAWDINAEEQYLCRRIVNAGYIMGLSIGLKTDDYNLEDTYYTSTQNGYFEDPFASFSEEDADLRYYFSAPFFMLRSMTHKERMYALNDMLKMEKKVLDHVLAKLMHLTKVHGHKAEGPTVNEIYRKIMGELPRVYWSDLLPDMYNNSIAPYKDEVEDGKGIITLGRITYQAYNGKRFSLYKYVPMPRLDSYPEDKFGRSMLLNGILATPFNKLDALDVEARASVRNNMQLYYYCKDPSVLKAWEEYKIDIAGDFQDHFEANNNFRVSTVPQIAGMLTYIEDGEIMYHKYRERNGMVPVTGNVRNRYKKARLNHALEETIDIDEKLRVAGVSVNDTENDLICAKELPKKLETYRIKKGAALVQLGKVLGHCIGNYASSSKGEYLFFRYKTVCARVDKDFRSVLECFDAHNKRTVKAKAFEKFLYKSMSLMGTAPAKVSSPFGVGVEQPNYVVFNNNENIKISCTGTNNFATLGTTTGIGRFYVIKDTVLE